MVGLGNLSGGLPGDGEERAGILTDLDTEDVPQLIGDDQQGSARDVICSVQP